MEKLLNGFMFLGKLFTKTRFPLLYFLFFYSCVLSIGLYFPVSSTMCFVMLFYLCISISYLNRKRQQQKRQVIEGYITEESAELIYSSRNMHESFLVFVQIGLLWVVTLLLRQISLSGDFFQPQQIQLTDWIIYSFDLILKAVLFDIPEIYHFNLIDIQHKGFWGSTAVFIARIIILVLVLGSLLNRYELRNILKNSVVMLDKHPVTAETRILTIVKLYPNLFRLLRKHAQKQWSVNIVKNLLIVLGKTKSKTVLPILERYLNDKSPEIVEGSLKGLEYLGEGSVKTIKSFLEKVDQDSDLALAANIKEQCFATLASWNTEESVNLLKEYTSGDEYNKNEAIKALGIVEPKYASSRLIEIMLGENDSKVSRFAAKDSLVLLEKIPMTDIEILIDQLQTSEKESNRRFAAMVLGATPFVQSFPVLLHSLSQDQDNDVRAYCAKGVVYFSRLAYMDDAFFQKEMWENIYNIIQKVIATDPYDITRVEAINSLKYIIRLKEKGIDIPISICTTIESALHSDSLRLADTTQNLLEHFNDNLNWHNWNLSTEFLRAWEKLFEEFESYHVEASVCLSDTPMNWDDSFLNLGELDKEEENSLPVEGKIFYDKYKCTKELYTGKYSQALLVQDLESNNEKVLKRLLSDQEFLQDNFQKEINMLRQFDHENIISIIDSGQDYFTMPYFENSLQQQLQISSEEKKLCPFEEFLFIIEKVCCGLIYLHQQKIYHCDIKPGNIYYHNKNIFIADFGSARKYGDKISMSGTPPYMAPEQVYNTNIDERTDIYSTGVLAYKILSNVDYSGVTKPLRDIRADLPQGIDQVLVQATAFSPKNRYSSIEKFWNAIKVL